MNDPPAQPPLEDLASLYRRLQFVREQEERCQSEAKCALSKFERMVSLQRAAEFAVKAKGILREITAIKDGKIPPPAV